MTPTRPAIGDDPPARSGPNGLDHRGSQRTKQVFLLAAFRQRDSQGPAASGVAEDVVAVMGVQGNRRRFEWVGDDQLDSIKNPALVVPVDVPMALPSPWHDDDEGMMTGLVELSADQLGDGSLDDDIDHLVHELGRSR